MRGSAGWLWLSCLWAGLLVVGAAGCSSEGDRPLNLEPAAIDGASGPEAGTTGLPQEDAGADALVDAGVQRPSFAPDFSLERSCSDDGETWEVCFDGKSLPGQGAYPHLAWDNPVDDAWSQKLFRSNVLQINLAPATFLRADLRNSNNKGWFLFRDPEISRERGITIRIKLRIPTGSARMGVHLLYSDPKEEFALHFNPDSIGFTNKISTSLVDLERPTSMLDWRDLRIQKAAGSSTVTVREKLADGTFVPILSGTATAGPNSAKGYPYVVTNFGVVASDGSPVAGTYELASLDFRRTSGPTKLTTVEPPRATEPIAWDHAVGTNAATCIGTTSHTFAELQASPDAASCSASTTKDVDVADRSHCAIGLNLKDGLLSGGTVVAHDNRVQLETAMTTEVRFRVTDGLQVPFGISGSEGPGAFAFDLTKDQVIPRSFGKPLSFVAGKHAPYAAGWNTLRLVRPKDSLYMYVYLNGTLVLRDYKIAFRADYHHVFAGKPGVSYLSVGTAILPASPELVWAQPGDVPTKGWGARSNVEVDCVRWANGVALAP